MMKAGSPLAVMIGRWGIALSIVAIAILLGRLIRNMPSMLPNGLPGLVTYELAPGLLLTAGIGVGMRSTSASPISFWLRLSGFLVFALIFGTGAVLQRV